MQRESRLLEKQSDAFRAIARQIEPTRVHGRAWGGKADDALLARWKPLAEGNCNSKQHCMQEQFFEEAHGQARELRSMTTKIFERPYPYPCAKTLRARRDIDRAAQPADSRERVRQGLIRSGPTRAGQAIDAPPATT